MDAFDADVLIYAAVPDHPLGRRVRALFPVAPTTATGEVAGIGSVLLIPELLTKPLRQGADAELEALSLLLSRLDLRPTDEATADRFVTNNTADFGTDIVEIAVTYPSDLPDL